MAVIDADGLKNGDRLRACSDLARLWWPYLFVQSNRLARLEINYRKLVGDFNFTVPLSEKDFYAILEEFQNNHLIFLYKTDEGDIWGQWWPKEGSFPSYLRPEDENSPAPPEDALMKWKLGRVRQTKTLPGVFQNLPTVSKISYRATRAAARQGNGDSSSLPKRQATSRASQLPIKTVRDAHGYGRMQAPGLDIPPLVLQPGEDGPTPAEYPVTLAKIREFFPDTDDGRCVQIVVKALQAKPTAPDEEIARYVQLAYQPGKQQSVGLFLHRVPEIIQRERDGWTAQKPKRSSGFVRAGEGLL